MKKEKRKKKILVFSDHALCTSGVGVQTRHLIDGLLARPPRRMDVLGNLELQLNIQIMMW